MVLTRVRVRDITGTFGPNLVEIVSTAWLGAVCRGQGKSQDDEDETAGSMKAYPGGKAMEAIARASRRKRRNVPGLGIYTHSPPRTRLAYFAEPGVEQCAPRYAGMNGDGSS
jgi:hypothetical protein